MPKVYLAQIDTCDGPKYAGVFSKREDAQRACLIYKAKNDVAYQAFDIELELDPALEDPVFETKYTAISTHWELPYIVKRVVERTNVPRSGSVDLSIGSQICFKVWSFESESHAMELYHEYVKEHKPK